MAAFGLAKRVSEVLARSQGFPASCVLNPFWADHGSGLLLPIGHGCVPWPAACVMQLEVYIVDGMTEWEIEIESEVQDWLELLPFRLYRRVEDKTDRLLGEPTTLGEPYSRHLGGKLRELRFELDGEAVRIPYWLAPGQRIVLLTVFRKTRMREAVEVDARIRPRGSARPSTALLSTPTIAARRVDESQHVENAPDPAACG